MLIAFPNGEHTEVEVQNGTTTLGSADTNDIVLTEGGIEPSHACLNVDHRGITLSINALDTPVYVNSRRVVEKAILRLGDVVQLNNLSLVLKMEPDRVVTLNSDSPNAVSDDASDDHDMPPRFYLRGIEGEHIGRLIPIHDQISIGNSDDCDLVITATDASASHHAIISNAEETVEFHSLNGATAINGNEMTNVALNPGDQIVFGDDRFMLESPAFVPGRVYAGVGASSGSNTQVFKAPIADEISKQSMDEGQPANQLPSTHRRDQIIITTCVILSLMMLIWLFINL